MKLKREADPIEKFCGAHIRLMDTIMSATEEELLFARNNTTNSAFIDIIDLELKRRKEEPTGLFKRVPGSNTFKEFK